LSGDLARAHPTILSPPLQLPITDYGGTKVSTLANNKTKAVLYLGQPLMLLSNSFTNPLCASDIIFHDERYVYSYVFINRLKKKGDNIMKQNFYLALVLALAVALAVSSVAFAKGDGPGGNGNGNGGAVTGTGSCDGTGAGTGVGTGPCDANLDGVCDDANLDGLCDCSGLPIGTGVPVGTGIGAGGVFRKGGR
jgi:hypothetical protein